MELTKFDGPDDKLRSECDSAVRLFRILEGNRQVLIRPVKHIVRRAAMGQR